MSGRMTPFLSGRWVLAIIISVADAEPTCVSAGASAGIWVIGGSTVKANLHLRGGRRQQQQQLATNRRQPTTKLVHRARPIIVQLADGSAPSVLVQAELSRDLLTGHGRGSIKVRLVHPSVKVNNNINLAQRFFQWDAVDTSPDLGG